MESIGEKLRGAREEKGYSIDQVARDTNIARRYIEALEREDFSVFPGDTYVLGFLRNYSDYLGLDPDKVITLYKNLKIQEQPVPVQELIQRKRRIPVGLIAVVVLGAAVLGGGGYGIYYLLQQRSAEAPAAAQESGQDEEQDVSREPDYVLRDEIVERRFASGDLIRVRLGEKEADLRVEGVGETVRLRHQAGTEEIALGREMVVDVDGDDRDDIKVSVHDIDTSANTAVLRFDRSLYEASGDTAELRETAVEEGAEPAIGSTSLEAREEEAETIVSGETSEPFQVSVVFRGYCLVRYLKDRSIREERYFNKGETFQLDVTEEVMLWISNAGSFKARVAGEEVSFGGPGEVSVKLVRWERDEDAGISRLKLIPVY